MKKIKKLQFEGVKTFLDRVGYSPNLSDDKLQEILDGILSNPALTQREIEILTERYGLKDNTGGTYKEVGSRLGCTGNNVRLLEKNALRKIHHPERHSELSRTRVRLRKLIPGLEYDVLYDPSDLARKIEISNRHVGRVINELCDEFDLTQIKPYLKSDRYFVIRIGEQSQDLLIPDEPSEHPCRNPLDCLHSLTQKKYTIEYMRFWEKIISRIENSGYASSNFDLGRYFPELRQKVFKDFMRDSMLPVAVHQDYRIGFREPIVIYHPKILREVRNS